MSPHSRSAVRAYAHIQHLNFDGIPVSQSWVSVKSNAGQRLNREPVGCAAASTDYIHSWHNIGRGEREVDGGKRDSAQSELCVPHTDVFQ